MKVAIFGESPADEAAIKVLVEAILGEPVEQPAMPSLRTRGYTQMVNELPRVIKALYFNTDAEALVIVIDANGDSIHGPEHDVPGQEESECRLCALRSTAQRELARLRSLPGRSILRFAVGLAVPTIECWLLSQTREGMTEANWRMARGERPPREPYTRIQLKELAYGTATPVLEQEKQKMLEFMTEVTKDLKRLRTAFPGGFSPMMDEIKSWKNQ